MVFFINLFLIFILAAPIVAQGEDEARSEWDEFRFTDYDYQVSAGLREVQQLMGGRESLLQSYQRTDQSRIATQREIEKLYQDQINTEKAALSYYEALLNFKFPEIESEGKDIDGFPINDLAENDPPVLESIEEEQPPIPPRIRVHSLFETSDGVSIELENLGDPVDALISVADAKNTIISNPYHIALDDWSYSRRVDFKLLSKEKQINLLIDTGSKGYKIPLFIRKQVASPRVIAFPLEQTAKVGESVAYRIVIEGDGSDRRRYPISVSNLPRGMVWRIVQVIPATTPDEEPRSVAVRNVQFSQALSRHELALKLMLRRNLPKALIGKPQQFTLQVGPIRETLSITPQGVGELAIDVPTIVQIKLGESKPVTVEIRNVGTEAVSGIAIRSAGTTYGVDIQSETNLTLGTSERRELPVTITIADDASLGKSTQRLIVSSSAGSVTAEMRVEIQPKALGLALLSGMTQPVLIIVVLVIVGYGGMKVQTVISKRKAEQAADYDLSPNYEVGGDD